MVTARLKTPVNKNKPNNPKRIRTAQKDNIVRIAGKLLAKASYSEMTVDEIARIAGINKALVYYYFKNKAFLVYEVACRSISSHSAFSEPIIALDLSNREKLRQLVLGHIQWRLGNPEIGGLTQKDLRYLPPRLRRDYIALRDRYEGTFRQIIADGMNNGEFRKADPKLVTMFVLGLANSIDRWFNPKGAISADDIAGDVWSFISYSLNPCSQSEVQTDPKVASLSK